jgi:multiple sugar transport system permease protein
MSRLEELPIGDLRLPIERQRTEALAPAPRADAHDASSNRKSQISNRKSRFINYYVSRGWLHLVLLTGVAIFIFPFVWMIGTSMKTDDEVTSDKWLPAVPTFVPRSPYALAAPDLVKPMQVDPAAWARLTPRLVEVTRHAVDAAMNTRPAVAGVDAVAHRDAAANVVINRLVARLNADLWTAGDAKLIDAYRALLTPELIDEALVDRLARFEIRGLMFRTLDAHMTAISDPKDVAATWRVESGAGTLVAGADGTPYLAYNFTSPSAPPIVLRKDFQFPSSVADWHKLIFSYKGDSTFHRIDAAVDVAGQRWVGTKSTYLYQSRPASILLQPPTFEDDSYKVHNWVPLRLESSMPQQSADALRHATLRLTLWPSSTAAAIGAKVKNNYVRALDALPFWQYVRNSVALVVLSTIGTLFSSTFVAYAFARLRWPGRSVAFVLLLSTMMLPAQVTMIPSFIVWRQLGWYNTLNPMWVPAWCGVAFFIFLMVQHMKTIPRELEESARIDGMNALQTWWYVIVPLVKPAAAAIAIMTVMGAWNEFMGPLIYLRDQARFPLSLGLFGIRAEMGTGGSVDWTLMMAGNVLMTLPVLVMFVVFQKYFVQGMTMSGMKG